MQLFCYFPHVKFCCNRYLNGCTFITESYTNNLCEGQLVAVMALASRAKDIEKCNELFNRIISTTKNQPSQFAINAYLYFCVANRLPLTFLDTVNQYTVKLSPTFAGFFSSMCSTEEDINSAYNHLWTSFQQEKCVTMDAFDALIRACAQSGNMPRAMSIFADCLNEFKLTPEIGSFNGLIGILICSCTLRKLTYTLQRLVQKRAMYLPHLALKKK